MEIARRPSSEGIRCMLTRDVPDREADACKVERGDPDLNSWRAESSSSRSLLCEPLVKRMERVAGLEPGAAPDLLHGNVCNLS
jgi:hypothetical protein